MSDLTVRRVEDLRAVQPGRWRPVLLPLLALVSLVVVETAMSSEGGCSVADPCGHDWSSGVEIPLLVGAAVALVVWPAVGALLTVAAAASVALVELGPFDGRVTDFGTSNPLVSLGGPVLVIGCAAVAEAVRRRRAATADEILRDVPRAPFPGAVPPVRVGTVRIGIAALVLVGGAASWGYGVAHGRDVARQEAQAERVVGTVVAHEEDGYVVDVLVGDVRWPIDTIRASDYPVGAETEVLLLEDGDARMAAERYDPGGWWALAVAALLLGGLLAGTAWRDRRGVRALFAQPQPVLRARLSSAWTGDQVLAVDGEAPPLLQLDLEADVAFDEAAFLEDDANEDEDEDEDEDELPEPVVATVYGVPLRGQVLGAVLSDGTRLLPRGRAKRGDPLWRQQWEDIALDEVADGAEEPAPVVAAAEVAQWRADLLRPEWWRAPLGVLLAAGSLAAAYVVTREAESAFTTLWRCAIVASFAFDGLVHLVTRVQLTEAGLVHEGPTTRRTVPWSLLRSITVADGGVVLVRTGEEVIPLTWLPHRPRLGGKARRADWARRWAAVLAAEARVARPSGDSRVGTEARLHAAVLALLFTAAVLLGLSAR
jgi:hypothetical protein